MKKDEDLFNIEDDETAKYIFNHLSEDNKKRISEDDIDYILDIMCDYYDKTGVMDESASDEIDINEEEMFQFIQKAIKKDKVATHITDEDIQTILDGEFEYGKSIGMYKEA